MSPFQFPKCIGLPSFFCLCLTSELCPAGTVNDWTRNSQTPREGDFESDRDSNGFPWSLHDSSSGGDSVYRLSAITCLSFRSISFTIISTSPMLVQKMSTPRHGNVDSARISTSTRLPDACNTRPATDLNLQYKKVSVSYTHLTLPTIYSV